MEKSRDKPAKSFGNFLKEIRVSANFTQEKFAERCLIDRFYISLLERGSRQPSLVYLFKISRELEITPALLLDRFTQYNDTNPE